MTAFALILFMTAPSPSRNNFAITRDLRRWQGHGGTAGIQCGRHVWLLPRLIRFARRKRNLV